MTPPRATPADHTIEILAVIGLFLAALTATYYTVHPVHRSSLSVRTTASAERAPATAMPTTSRSVRASAP